MSSLANTNIVAQKSSDKSGTINLYDLCYFKVIFILSNKIIAVYMQFSFI